MPGKSAKRGDIYRVDKDATTDWDKKPMRPMICVAERPEDDYVWTGMSRTTTSTHPEAELESQENTIIGLSKSGWWSHRFVRSVKKRWTGHASLCPYLGRLPETLERQVLDHYKTRPRVNRTRS